MTESVPLNQETPQEHRVDPNNPWPGLAAFEEQDQKFFRGREAETDALERLVLRDRLTVMFGVSGLGKTSLLQAGLFPRLRERLILPVSIRFDFSESEPDLRGQVLSALVEAAGDQIESPEVDGDRTLWEHFHRRDAEFWNERNRLVTPLLVFDQFEEIFTLGQSSPGRARATRKLIDELASLIEGHPPAEVRARLNETPEAARDFSYKDHGYKVLLSLREDFLPHLEELGEQIPSIVHNRFRLKGMTGESAMKVAAQDEALMPWDVAERVVRFVGAAEDIDTEVPLEELEIEPAQLCVVCRELNNKRRARQEKTITADLLEGSREEILVDLYHQSVTDLNPAVQTLIEERLLTESGFRDSIAIETALEIPGVEEEDIERLIDRRLLRAEERSEVPRIELTHDLLTGVIVASRDARRQHEADQQRRAEEARRRREVEAKEREARREAEAKEKLLLSRKRSAAVVVLLLLVFGLAWQSKARRDAEIRNEKLADVLRQEQACEQRGDTEACAKLERLYEGGEVAARTAREPGRFGLFFARVLCRLGGATACAKLGDVHDSAEAGRVDAGRRGEFYSRAAKLYGRSCDRGKADSCAGLATLYDRGLGVEENAARAAELYADACDKGVPESCGSLGKLSQWGRGVPRDEAKAIELFRRACDGESAEGCYNLGLLYRWGASDESMSFPADPTAAQTRFSQSCELGSGAGCYKLGRGAWKEGDEASAAQLYEKACTAGSSRGCRWIGYAYETGRGVNWDLARAVSFYAQSCSIGMGSACYRLGNLHAKQTRNYARAVELYQRACDAGSGSGCRELGVHFEKGDGVFSDGKRAADLFQQACSRGNPGACQLVAFMDQAPEIGAMSEDELQIAERECKNQSLEACLGLGTLAESLGQFAEAEHWYSIAVLTGAASTSDAIGYADALYALAAFYIRAGKYGQVSPLYQLYQAALRSIRKAGGKDVFYARSLGNLAAIYTSRLKYTKARPRYKEAIGIQQAAIESGVLSEEDPLYLTFLTNLAVLYAENGDYQDSEELYQEVLRIRTAMGDRDPQYAALLGKLGMLRDWSGRAASAESLFQESLDIVESAYGANHISSVSDLVNLGRLYGRAGWYAEAESYYLEALSIAKASAGKNTPYYTTSLNNLVSLLIRTGQDAEAESLWRREGPPNVGDTSGTYNLLYKATIDKLERVSQRGATSSSD